MRHETITGRIDIHKKGFGFVKADVEGVEDIFIPIAGIKGAMHGDSVEVMITRDKEEGRRREGKVIKITERAITRVIGKFQDEDTFGFVIPEDMHIHNDIYIGKGKKNGAKNGEIVVVDIDKYPEGKKRAEGHIVEILGTPGDKGLDILTVARKYGLPDAFPDKVLRYAEGIEEEIPAKEYERRRDLRDIRMVTIDGADAKDLDDAVHIKRLHNGFYELGVHIADVTHYVREKNPLDKEALKRGTSVYLIDRVIPMLPKKLSNGICSLNPNVDRLTLSCIMVIDDRGKVVNHEIVEGVIRTNERMTYDDVNSILKGEADEELLARYDYLIDDFKAMEELCLILRKKRMRRGAIDFNFEESKIILDELGKPVDIYPDKREIANKLIEEFMLVANETIAEEYFWLELPFVYRVHEDPDESKLEKFKDFCYNLGYPVRPSQELHPRHLQEVLEKVAGKKEETVVSTLLLRSLMKAKYMPQCVGHFGLSAEYYCHFTSPIRRYPDLQIHRIIKEHINGELTPKRAKQLIHIVEVAAEQSSKTERVAEEAEREVDDLKKAEYMQDRIGETFEGHISSIASFGIFVQLPNTIEGLIHLTSLEDDIYIYDEATLSMIGERTKKTFKLGDEIKVVCSRVDIDNRDIYFEIYKDEDNIE